MAYQIEMLPWLPRADESVKESLKRSFDQEKVDVGGLQSSLGYWFGLNDLRNISSSLEEKLGDNKIEGDVVKIAFLSDTTSNYITSALQATCLRHGVVSQVYAGLYGQVWQEVYDDASQLYKEKPDIVFLSLTLDFFNLQQASLSARTDELSEASSKLIALVEAIKTRTGAAVIVQNFMANSLPLMGNYDAQAPGSILQATNYMNTEVAKLADQAGVYLFDLNTLAATVGSARWFNLVQWHMAKLPFDMEFVPIYTDSIARIIGAIKGKSRKCLVLDLDNTLWGGVIGDDGVENILVGSGSASAEAFSAVQRYARQLKERGIILAVCSKNEEENALLPFKQHDEMLLKEDDFAIFVANWNDKASNLQYIAKTLNIGLDALVFLDDNPAERVRVRQSLPEVAVIEPGDDATYYCNALASSGWFETIAVSADDMKRAEQYRTNVLRSNEREKIGNISDYLISLDMKANIAPFNEQNRKRVTQLVNKTNQFNMTTKRYDEADIESFEKDSRYFTYQVKLADKFGDNGIVSVVIIEHTDNTWVIDSWLMSCRVFGRRLEHCIMNYVVEQARSNDIDNIIGLYSKTAKNSLVADLYGQLGFEAAPDNVNKADTSSWALKITDYQAVESYISL
ncbi:HAD family hydrolase [Kordiimonas sp. SCSIO 12610]|uniref:HAD-IIIC family phosphatase n=1 Tax=Kordiimonas sp. SCSIO 12610 TaxID=2829597 RepID=UPI00210C4EB1|nr:HAD-IIIC family phosphatase [Kordiimonas sp. SCSIO 12610]UTW55884.1 HAD family hydrolase [Kordiimonas sp. SCSIO 12610]